VLRKAILARKRIDHRIVPKSRGQSLVEFALVLPLLLVLIITGIELGRLFFTQIVITNAAREGAYYMATHFEDANAAANATAAAEAEAENSGIPEITVTLDSCVNTGNCIVATVNTTVDDLTILGFVGNIFSITTTHNSFDLSASVEMMAE